MAKDHFLPACFIAQFSNDQTVFPARDRQLIVGDLITKKIYPRAAKNIASIKDFYTDFDDDGNPDYTIDNTWKKYENQLPDAINKLLNRELDAETWVRILVPFVTGLFIRGIDFDKRLSNRLDKLSVGNLVSKENSNRARLIELQRLLASVIAAKWIVVTIHGHGELITNDLGYAPYANLKIGDKGIAIPIDPHHVLAISPQHKRNIIVAKGNKWVPIIQYVDEPPNSHLFLNNVLASAAHRNIFGSNEKTINDLISIKYRKPQVIEPFYFGFLADPLARAYEFTWHRLVSVLQINPTSQENFDFKIDWKNIPNGWYPPVFFPMNLIEFPSTLSKRGKYINIEFYDPKIYYSISRCLNCLQYKDFEAAVVESTKALPEIENDNHIYLLLLTRAEAYTELGIYDKAFEDYHSAQSLIPNKPDAYANEGYLYLLKEEYTKAIPILSLAIELDSTYGPAIFNRGKCYFEIGEIKKAFSDFEESLSVLPSSSLKVNAYLMIGELLQNLGKTDDAINNYSKALLLISDSSEKVYCYNQRAFLYMQKDMLIEAENDLAESIQLEKENATAFYLRGQIYTKQQKHKKAINDFTKIPPDEIEQSQKARLHNLLGKCYLEEKEFSKASMNFDLALAIANDNTEAFFNKGLCCFIQVNLSEAKKYFETTLDLFPNHIGAINNLGTCYLLESNVEKAIFFFNLAISKRIDSTDRIRAYRNKAIAYIYKNDNKNAQKSLNKIIKLLPNEPLTLIYSGRLQLLQGNFSESYLTFQEILRRDIQQINNPFIALSLLLNNDKEQSIEIITKWIGQNPAKVNCQAILCDIRYLQGKYPQYNDSLSEFSTPISNYLSA
jgi:tetratricopeptide (TPR) repeat protein